MKGEYISIETSKIMADIEKENKELHDRIDNATAFIEVGRTFKNEETRKEVDYIFNNLLEILKGE